MICDRCKAIPLGLFLGDRSIQYALHCSFVDFVVSAINGCDSCRILLQQRASQVGRCLPFIKADGDGDSYWIEWDNELDRLVLASGWNHCFLEFDSETGLRTSGKALNLGTNITARINTRHSLDIVPALAATSSPESLGIIRTWLDKCLTEHQQCRNGNGTLPTRLLDVGPADGSEDPRIVCQPLINNQKTRYLALSYCWGQSTKQSSWTLNAANIDRFKAGIPLD